MANQAQIDSAALACELHHGDPLMVDYTPSGAAVKAGTMIALSAGCTVIAHNDMADGELGAVAFPGGNAVYRVDLGSGESYSVGDAVLVDIATQEAKAAGTQPLGTCVAVDVNESLGDTVVYVAHHLPYPVS